MHASLTNLLKVLGMKHTKHVCYSVKKALNSLGLSFFLLAVLASNGLANEHKMAIEPLNALPTANESIPQQVRTPLLLLAQAASSKAEAAQIAKSQHGGKVLSVRKSGNGWQVKLLLDDGRVKLVYVDGNGSGK